MVQWTHSVPKDGMLKQGQTTQATAESARESDIDHLALSFQSFLYRW